MTATLHTPAALRAWLPPSRRVVVALLRRDSAERRFLGLPFVLDVLFGLVNLVVFLFISRVLRHPSPVGTSVSYFDFVAVGITFMLVVQAACTQITSRVQEEQRSGTLEMLAAQPVTPGALALGLSAYPMAFSVVRAAAYLAVAVALLGLDVGAASWPGVVVVLLLGGAATTALGIVLAAFSVAVGHGETLARLVVLALSFASGTYFPVTALPPVLQALSGPLPTRITLDGLRDALSGGSWTGSALLLAVAAAVGLPVAVRLFGLALRVAVRRGTLTRG